MVRCANPGVQKYRYAGNLRRGLVYCLPKKITCCRLRLWQSFLSGTKIYGRKCVRPREKDEKRFCLRLFGESLKSVIDLMEEGSMTQGRAPADSGGVYRPALWVGSEWRRGSVLPKDCPTHVCLLADGSADDLRVRLYDLGGLLCPGRDSGRWGSGPSLSGRTTAERYSLQPALR